MITQALNSMSIKSELKKKIKLQSQNQAQLEKAERGLILSRWMQFAEDNEQELANYSKPFILDLQLEDPAWYPELFLADGSFDETALTVNTKYMSQEIISDTENLSIEELRRFETEEEYLKLWKSWWLVPEL